MFFVCCFYGFDEIGFYMISVFCKKVVLWLYIDFFVKMILFNIILSWMKWMSVLVKLKWIFEVENFIVENVFIVILLNLKGCSSLIFF